MAAATKAKREDGSEVTLASSPRIVSCMPAVVMVMRSVTEKPPFEAVHRNWPVMPAVPVLARQAVHEAASFAKNDHSAAQANLIQPRP